MGGFVKGAVLFSLALSLGLLSPVAVEGGGRHRDLERLAGGYGVEGAAYGALERAFGSALSAGQDDDEALGLVETCFEGGFDTGETVRVVLLYAQLELASLPDEGFLLKVREGVAKRVEPVRIVQAAERRALMVRAADQLLSRLVLEGVDLDEGGKAELVPAVAEALESGREPSQVREEIVSALESGRGVSHIRRRLLR